MHIDLSTKIKSLQLKNPTILASGILGQDVVTMKRIIKNGAGAVTLKSLTSQPRVGHNSPIFVQASEEIWLNAVGYANKGIEKGVEEFKKWDSKSPLIGSIVASDTQEFAALAQKIIQTPISALELALSCPHTPGYGVMGGQANTNAVTSITKEVRKITSLPLIVKLSATMEKMIDLAKAAEAVGADAINMGNTLGPGMKIDINRRSPILGFKIGGLSGPGIRPFTIRSVYDLFIGVKIPIIATGGIMTGEDAIEAIMAGATAIGIGTGVYYRGIRVFKKVVKEINDWMKENGYNNLEEIRGLVHYEK